MANDNDQMASQGQLVAVNGMDMYYRVVGQGPALVLMHGFFGESHTLWDALLHQYAREHRVVVPDLRGHGRSSNPSGTFTHRQAALDVYALLDHLGIDQFRGIGFSTGGMTLLHMATQQPARTEALVLASATTYFPESARAIMRQTTTDNMTPQELKEQRRRHGTDARVRALRGQFHGFKDSYDDMNFTPPLLGTISARTLIVHGDRDQFFPISIPMGMYEAIPDAYLLIVPNGDHGLYQSDRGCAITRDIFQRVTLEFLRGDWGSGNQG